MATHHSVVFVDSAARKSGWVGVVVEKRRGVVVVVAELDVREKNPQFRTVRVMKESGGRWEVAGCGRKMAG